MFKRVYLAVLAVGAVALAAMVAPGRTAAVDNVDVTVTILTYQEIDCPDGTLVPCPGDYYGKIAIGPHDFVKTPYGPADTGLHSPYWRITKSVDRDAASVIPVRIELWDDDLDDFNPDDHIDIAAGDNTLDLMLNLDTGNWTGEAGPNGTWSTGDGNDSARVLFDVSLSSTGDLDGDGIPDGVERFGIRKIEDGALVTDLRNFGAVDPRAANPCQKTILMEIDWMGGAADGHNHRPKDAALQEIQDAFAAAPVPGVPCPYTQLGFGGQSGVQLMIDRSNQIPEQTVLGLGAAFDAVRDAPGNFIPQRRPYFHYVLFVHQQGAGSGSSGLCCEDGTDFIVSLGTWRTLCVGAGPNGTSESTPVGDDVASGGNITNGADRTCNSTAAGDDRQLTTVGNSADHDVGTVRDQSGTLMHELGHSLNLEHRGNSDVNHTPNYLSAMNYLFQQGVPNNGAPGSVLDYSPDALPTLDERTLNETAGAGGPAALLTLWFDPTGALRSAPANGPTDWDRDGTIGTASFDINADATCVTAGADGTLDTAPAADDAIANGVIHNGADNICQTMPVPGSDDVRPTTGSGGTPINSACVDAGPNGRIDGSAGGDDIKFTNRIRSGPNLVCNSTATGDDVQTVAVGLTETFQHPGFDDWRAIQFRAPLAPFASGGGAGHIGDLHFHDVLAFEQRFLELLDPDLSVTKTVDLADASPGDLLTYTVKATNGGTGDAAQVHFDDTLPDGTLVQRTRNDVIAGASATETFTYTVPCGTADGTVLTNNVSVLAHDRQGGTEVNLSNNQASASTTVHAPVLTLDKTATTAVNAGEAITYRLTYANVGSGAAASVTITDTLPAGMYYTTALDLGAGPRPDSVIVNADGTRTLTWTVGALAAGSGASTIEYTARPTLLAIGGDAFMNGAELTFTDANGCTYPPVEAAAATTITEVTPSFDVRTRGYWSQHPTTWTAEMLARIQATDQRYDGFDGSTPDGALSAAEVQAAFIAGGNHPEILQEQLLATYFNLATRRVNAATLIESRLTARLGLTNVRDAVVYATDTLGLPVDRTTKPRYSDATTVLDALNNGRSFPR